MRQDVQFGDNSGQAVIGVGTDGRSVVPVRSTQPAAERNPTHDDEAVMNGAPGERTHP